MAGKAPCPKVLRVKYSTTRASRHGPEEPPCRVEGDTQRADALSRAAVEAAQAYADEIIEQSPGSHLNSPVEEADLPPMIVGMIGFV